MTTTEAVKENEIPGFGLENPRVLTEDELERLQSDEIIEELVRDGEANDNTLYITSIKPQAIDRPDGSRVVYDTWAIDTSNEDFGTMVLDRGAFLHDDNGDLIQVLTPRDPEQN